MKIGIAGTGTMGAPMARKLASAGHEVQVWNRTREKTEALAREGMEVAGSLAELAASSDVVMSSVLDDAALTDIALGEGGILEHLEAEGVHCDTSTITPSAAEGVAAAYTARGKRFVHAPVLGSKKQIMAGELLIFVSGQERDFEIARPALQGIGKRFWHLAGPGEAAGLKLACNMLIASMITGFSQSLVFAAKLGLDPNLFVDVIQESALGCNMYSSKSRQIIERDFSANFFVDNLIKDLDLALEAAQENGIPMPTIALIQQLFTAASARGYGREDYSAVCKILEEAAEMDTSTEAS